MNRHREHVVELLNERQITQEQAGYLLGVLESVRSQARLSTLGWGAAAFCAAIALLHWQIPQWLAALWSLTMGPGGMQF
jgi:hypothetical protein